MSQPVTILINVLDDDSIILDFIQRIFKDEIAYTVNCYNTANEFIGNFTKEIDLIITDVRVEGYDVIETIKTVSLVNPGCYIIVMSAYFDVAILKEFIKLRVDGVVEKGPSLEWLQELKQTVDRLKPKLIDKAHFRKNDN